MGEGAAGKSHGVGVGVGGRRRVGGRAQVVREKRRVRYRERKLQGAQPVRLGPASRLENHVPNAGASGS